MAWYVRKREVIYLSINIITSTPQPTINTTYNSTYTLKMSSTPSSLSDSICANCGKCGESCGDLKACTACKLVKYCNRNCQIAHRPQHKTACKKRAAELYDAALFEEHAPEECPICMLPPPLYDTHTGMTFQSCCGKEICDGCIYAMRETGGKNVCPFCKTPYSKSDEETIKRGN